MSIVIAGFGAIGSFIYFILSQNKLNPLVFSKRKQLDPYQITFLSKKPLTHKIEKLNTDLLPNKIDYLFLCCKAYQATNYLQEIITNSHIENLILTQNGIGLEEEVINFLKTKNSNNINIFYLTLTTGLQFVNNELLVYNPNKSQGILTKINQKDFTNSFTLDYSFTLHLGNRYLDFGFSGNHLSVRFSKLILNLISNVVPSSYGQLPWQVFTENKEAIKLEKALISEIYDFMKNSNIAFFNFKGYKTSLIAYFYRYCPSWIFEKIYSNPNLLKKLRNNRPPSFYNDLIINKTKTEIKYYLGWSKKYPHFQFKTIKLIYEKIKELEMNTKKSF